MIDGLNLLRQRPNTMRKTSHAWLAGLDKLLDRSMELRDSPVGVRNQRAFRFGHSSNRIVDSRQ